MDAIRLKFPEDEAKASYLLNRGIDQKTILDFEVGYSSKKNRLVIPARNEFYKAVGFIGRAMSDSVQPKYLYSKGFPRKDILFNLDKAKSYDSCIVVEGSIDAMKIYSAGFKNVVATLGAAVTKEHFALMKKYFDSIIIFSDNDHAGYAMRDLIINSCSELEISIAKYPNDKIKDPGEMSPEQISWCLENSFGHLDCWLDV